MDPVSQQQQYTDDFETSNRPESDGIKELIGIPTSDNDGSGDRVNPPSSPVKLPAKSKKLLEKRSKAGEVEQKASKNVDDDDIDNEDDNILVLKKLYKCICGTCKTGKRKSKQTSRSKKCFINFQLVSKRNDPDEMRDNEELNEDPDAASEENINETDSDSNDSDKSDDTSFETDSEMGASANHVDSECGEDETASEEGDLDKSSDKDDDGCLSLEDNVEVTKEARWRRDEYDDDDDDDDDMNTDADVDDLEWFEMGADEETMNAAMTPGYRDGQDSDMEETSYVKTNFRLSLDQIERLPCLAFLNQRVFRWRFAHRGDSDWTSDACAFKVFASVTRNFDSAYHVLDELVGYMPLDEIGPIWSQLVHASCVQSFTNRLKLLSLLVKIIRRVYDQEQAPSSPPLIDLFALRPLKSLHYTLELYYKLDRNLSRALYEIFYFGEKLAIKWRVEREYVARMRDKQVSLLNRIYLLPKTSKLNV